MLEKATFISLSLPPSLPPSLSLSLSLSLSMCIFLSTLSNKYTYLFCWNIWFVVDLVGNGNIKYVLFKIYINTLPKPQTSFDVSLAVCSRRHILWRKKGSYECAHAWWKDFSSSYEQLMCILQGFWQNQDILKRKPNCKSLWSAATSTSIGGDNYCTCWACLRWEDCWGATRSSIWVLAQKGSQDLTYQVRKI